MIELCFFTAGLLTVKSSELLTSLILLLGVLILS